MHLPVMLDDIWHKPQNVIKSSLIVADDISYDALIHSNFPCL
jgi:hypothetical protein